MYILRGTVYVMYQRYCVYTVREGLCTYCIRGTVYTLYERVCVRTEGYCVRTDSEVLCRYCTRRSVYVLKGSVYVVYCIITVFLERAGAIYN